MAGRSNGLGRGTGLVLVILSLTGLMVSFSESMLIPALPTLQAEFHTTEAVVSWVPAIYLLFGSLTTPTFGKLGDTYGKEVVARGTDALHDCRYRKRVRVEHR